MIVCLGETSSYSLILSTAQYALFYTESQNLVRSYGNAGVRMYSQPLDVRRVRAAILVDVCTSKSLLPRTTVTS